MDAEKGPNQPESSPEPDDHADPRLEALDVELARLRQKKAIEEKNQDDEGESSALAMAWRLGADFISGVLVGVAIGLFIDRFFGVAPWGLIFFTLLGFCAGMLNMLRAAGKVPAAGDVGRPQVQGGPDKPTKSE